MDTKKMSRDSNFELLRIIAMLLIIGCHFTTYGKFDFQSGWLSLEALTLNVLRLGGKTGVIIFAMITGYFALYKEFKWQKIRDLSLQTSWYAIGLLIFMTVIVHKTLTPVKLVQGLFPLLMSTYWFATAFAILLLVAPVINLAMKNFEQRETTYVLGGLILLMGLPVATVFQNDVTGLVLAYALGAYVRRFDLKLPKVWNVVLMFVTVTAAATMTLIFVKGAAISPFFAERRNFFVTGFNINAYALALLLFLFAKQTKIGQIKFINLIASTTFGIYLFHDNRFFKHYLWENIVQANQLHGVDLAVRFISSVIVIFVVGMIIDFIRQLVFKGVKTIWTMMKAKKTA